MKFDPYRRQRGITSLEDAAAVPPPLLHPLAGSGWRHFRGMLTRHRGIAPRSRWQRWITHFALLERWPLAETEHWFVKGSLAAHKPSAPPVFLIGHWGSGTTRLHRLLSIDPQFAFPDLGDTLMPWNLFGTRRYCRFYLRKFIPSDRFFDAVEVSLDVPQEEEIALAALGPLSYFHALYFPSDYSGHIRRALFPETADPAEREAFEDAYRLFFQRISFRNGGKRILFKNPASTTRMPMLRRLFPGAKFVHLVRDPVEVYASSMNRLPFLLNAFAMEDFRGIDLHETTLATYESMMRRYLRDRGEMPEGSLAEVRFEDLESNPVGAVSRIYETLSLSGADEALAAMRSFLKAETPYRRTRRRLSPGASTAVWERWRFAFDAWTYPRS